MLAKLLVAATVAASASAAYCDDECTPFWALSCPTNDQTCLSTYCSTKSYDLYETCLSCWEDSKETNMAITQKSLVYQYICALVQMCDIRNSPIPGDAPSNIGCAAKSGSGNGNSAGAGAAAAGAVGADSSAAGAAASASPSEAVKGGAMSLAAPAGAVALFAGVALLV